MPLKVLANDLHHSLNNNKCIIVHLKCLHFYNISCFKKMKSAKTRMKNVSTLQVCASEYSMLYLFMCFGNWGCLVCSAVVLFTVYISAAATGTMFKIYTWYVRDNNIICGTLNYTCKATDKLKPCPKLKFRQLKLHNTSKSLFNV